jgi:hypothetical protein
MNENSRCIKAREKSATEMIIVEMKSQGVQVTLDKNHAQFFSPCDIHQAVFELTP